MDGLKQREACEHRSDSKSNHALRSLIVLYCAEHKNLIKKVGQKQQNFFLGRHPKTEAAIQAAKMTTVSFEVKKQDAY